MSKNKTYEFIAYKRTKKSSWLYSEFSEVVSKAIDDIAPNCGNFLKLHLIDKKLFEDLQKENARLRQVVDLAANYKPVGESYIHPLDLRKIAKKTLQEIKK